MANAQEFKAEFSIELPSGEIVPKKEFISLNVPIGASRDFSLDADIALRTRAQKQVRDAWNGTYNVSALKDFTVTKVR
jgi:hypothetical protein